jgi:thioesterase domain-containing protein
MARQLKQEGSRAGSLLLFDTHLPLKNRDLIDDRDNLPVFVRFAADWGRLLVKDTDPFREQFRELKPDQQRAMLFAFLKRAGLFADDAGDSEMENLLAVFTRNTSAIDQYTLRPSLQRVVLFIAAESKTPGLLADQWIRWAGRVELAVTPGDHYSLLQRPNVSYLAERLKPYLEISQPATK